MPKRVLIVEDEIFAALDLEEALTEAGYEVAGIAADQREALALAPRADIALVDLNLRDGPTGLAIGMALAENYDVRVLFLTANTGMVASGVTGAIGCLEKPCPPNTVCEAIAYAADAEHVERAPPRLKLFH